MCARFTKKAIERDCVETPDSACAHPFPMESDYDSWTILFIEPSVSRLALSTRSLKPPLSCTPTAAVFGGMDPTLWAKRRMNFHPHLYSLLRTAQLCRRKSTDEPSGVLGTLRHQRRQGGGFSWMVSSTFVAEPRGVPMNARCVGTPTGSQTGRLLEFDPLTAAAMRSLEECLGVPFKHLHDGFHDRFEHVFVDYLLLLG